jgi:hypothetical protein
MARKDDILKNFLTHELILNKYQLKPEELPSTVRDALNSDNTIVKAVSLIVEALEKSPTATDTELRNSVLQFLNTAI